MNKLNHLEKKINIKFKDKKLLERALFHRSYLNEVKNQKLRSNERLEFLGDAVLELWTTKQLFDNYPNLSEGILTNIRAAVVCTTCLAEIAEKMNLGDYLYLSKGEKKSGGRNNPSLLADTLEALIGAVYLDQGPKKAKEFLQELFFQKIEELAQSGNVKDAKTLLQELIQQEIRITPRYKIIEEQGPDHDKIFTSAVYYNNKKIAKGTGKSKRLAEETAAEKALTLARKKGTI